MNWTVGSLKPLSVGYKTALKDDRIYILNKNLVLYKPILTKDRIVALIIFPKYLIQKIFRDFHARPNGGHMGEYKTLYRERLCFFCTGLCEDVKKWVKLCAHCISFNIWSNSNR